MRCLNCCRSHPVHGIVVDVVLLDGFSKVGSMLGSQDQSWAQTQGLRTDTGDHDSTLQKPVLH